MAKTTEHKDSQASVKVVYYTSKKLADGTHPFMLRITKDRKRKYVATGLSLHPQYWNEQTGSFRRSLPADKRKFLEAALRKWEEKYGQAAEALAEEDQVHDAQSIAVTVSRERQSTRKYKLLSYFDALIEQFDKTGNVGNRRVYQDVKNALGRFIGSGQDVAFDGVTVRFCNQWETLMRSDGVADTSLSVRFRTLRAALNKAIANGFAKPTAYPFARNTAETHKFQIGKFSTKTLKRAISKTDIRSIEAYQPPLDEHKYAGLRNTQERLQLAKDLFLFSYYCGGINFIDIALLRWSNLGTDLEGRARLNYVRQKTGGIFSLPLLPQALTILDRYRLQTLHPAEYIFPILHTALHNTPTQRQNRCGKIMGQVNADLKRIGAAIGLETVLTTYVARHSFATALKRSGVTTGIISEAMGHQDERTTRIYLSEFDTELVDAAFDNL